jgi:hypothetical protein
MTRNRKFTQLTALAGLAALAACDSSTGAGMGTVRLLLTDAPAGVASATVWISRAELIPGNVLITDFGGVSTEYDLLALQGGVTALLGEALIPVGDYAQLRLIVDSARVVLEAPLLFEDGSSEKTLTVPSGLQTGIKVDFSGPVHVEPGVTMLVADFDVDRSFVFQGPPQGPKSVSFKPVIHATVADIAGSIAGTVNPEGARRQPPWRRWCRAMSPRRWPRPHLMRLLAPMSCGTAAGRTRLDQGDVFQAASQANVVVGDAEDVVGVDFARALNRLSAARGAGWSLPLCSQWPARARAGPIFSRMERQLARTVAIIVVIAVLGGLLLLDRADRVARAQRAARAAAAADSARAITDNPDSVRIVTAAIAAYDADRQARGLEPSRCVSCPTYRTARVVVRFIPERLCGATDGARPGEEHQPSRP